MKKTNILLPAALSLMMGVALTGCNDWLSVQPEQEVEDTELFKSQTGFKEALAGVYSSMVNDATYAKELTFGAMGVLAHEWDNTPTSYVDMLEYNYDAAYPTNTIANIWSTSYNSIANVNNILKHIDGAQTLFSGDNYSIIKGEALALRAFLHFDLLRCFGVSYEVNPSMPAIPYCTDLTYRVFPQLTVNEVAEAVLKDLSDAEALLVNDPIKTGREVTELEDGGYLINRTMHLNYYAVKAMQARVNMWMKRYDVALTAINEVLGSDKFTWATLDNMRNGYDHSLVTEQVFALNNVNLTNLGDNYFSEDRNTYSFSITSQTLLNYYENQTADYRYLYQFAEGTTGDYVDNRYLLKFVQSTSSESAWRDRMPMIRLAELLLMKSEILYRQNGSGLDELNELRTARGVVSLTQLPDDYWDALVKEYRRELIGEGQYFFMLKRLNRTYIPGTDVDAPAQKIYTFPIPISETEMAQRQPNR